MNLIACSEHMDLQAPNSAHPVTLGGEYDDESSSPRRRVRVVRSSIDALDWSTVLRQLSQWASRRESRYVCLCNVHSVVTASRHSGLRSALEQADLALPDGAPVALSLRMAGVAKQRRINGPDLMLRWLEQAQREGHSVYFYGSAQSTLDRLRAELMRAYPALKIAGMMSPPFRPLTEEEDEAIVETINASGAAVVFVGLGCPKQEIWMAQHRGRVMSVMLGVGAAFDYHAGVLKRAPQWMQNRGLEWVHRLYSEPRRLLWRYLSTNSVFIAWLLTHAIGEPLRRLRGHDKH